MNARVLLGGLIAAGCLLAQPGMGPRGRGPMGFAGPDGLGRGGPAARATVTGAPYAAVEVRTTQQVLATGNVIQRQEQTTVYRDAVGRVRRETTRTTPEGKTETRVTISDPVAGVVHELNATNKTAFSRPARFPTEAEIAAVKTRMQTMGATRTRAQASTEANVKSETLAAQSMHGLLASGTRVTRTIPAGTIGNAQAIESVRETWMADDLKVPLMTKVSDPRTGTVVTELTNINRSQPDASLFVVPADYTVKTGPGGPGHGPRPAARQ